MRVLINATVSDAAAEILKEHFQECEFQSNFNNSECEVLWCRLEGSYKRATLSEFPNLKVVVTPTTGTDHIDNDYCQKHGIEVLSLRGETEFLETVHATAEHTIALMLAVLRHIPFAATRTERHPYLLGTELHGKTVLIVGCGRVGKQVGKILDAFGCLVLYCDRDSDLLGTLPLADIVSVHVDLNETTREMFSRPEFTVMKPGAVFINTARGQVVDERELVRWMNQCNENRAAIDVHANDPNLCLVNGQLLITPHIGGYTRESREKTDVFMAKKLVAWAKARNLLEAAATIS